MGIIRNMWTIGLLMGLVACGDKDTDTAVEDTVQEDEEQTEDTAEVEGADDSDTTETGYEEASIDVCTLPDQEATSSVLPALEAEAAQLILIPGLGESYQLTKEAGAEGWFVLEVPSWMCDVELYTQEGVSIELESSPDWELGDVAAPVSECENVGLFRHSWTFHAWGSYVVHIQATDSTELWLGTRMVSQ